MKKHGIRVVDSKFVGDLDPLDKVMFIENEWDSYRDDFRDGRFHPHSKTSMDYIMAGSMGISPRKEIKLGYNPTNVESRVNFKPIYDKEGQVRGDTDGISLDEIPDDERQVKRTFEMEVEGHEIPDDKKTKVRKPSPFDPAFDRAALGKDFIHWGRMLYYETADAINMWSENPFPHISTRGIAKYLIDLAIRKHFSWEEARKALQGYEWDYGIRHYGPPYITDPLGEAAPGPEGKGGTGSLAGAK